MDKENKEISRDNQVVKANAMIESKFRLSVWEQRIILTLCSKINANQDTFAEFTLSVNEFCNFLDISNKDYKINSILKRKCKQLQNKSICINTGTKIKPVWTFFNWFHHIKYIENEGLICMQFHEFLEPYLLTMKDRYTKYKLGYVIKFKSEYSFRIYELLKEYETIGNRTLLISELKEYLDIDKESYNKYSHFKTKVLLKAQKEINQYSDISIELLEIKKGRKVDAIEFQIKRKDNYITPLDNWEDYQKMIKKSKTELVQILESMIKKKYQVNFMIKYEEIIHKDAIISLIQQLKEKEFENINISSPNSYFTQVLLNIHNDITGEELTKADIRRIELTKLLIESQKE